MSNNKCSEARFHSKQTEPQSTWQNAVQGTIIELKRGSGRNMTKAFISHKIQYHCLEQEGIIFYHTALDIFKLEGEVPETSMRVGTADINIIEDYAWYYQIKFYDHVGKQFLEKKMYLGRYLGPSIEVGPALTANILKSNGEVIHRSTYRYLLPEEVTYEKELSRQFNVMIGEKFGPKVVAKYFGKMGLQETPIFEKYEDDSVEGTPDEPPKELEPKPDLSLGFPLNMSIVLPWEDKLARGGGRQAQERR